MPRGGIIAARMAIKREKEEARRVKGRAAGLLSGAARSQTSPIDLSEPRANKHFVDFPPPPLHLSPKAAREADRGLITFWSAIRDIKLREN